MSINHPHFSNNYHFHTTHIYTHKKTQNKQFHFNFQRIFNVLVHLLTVHIKMEFGWLFICVGLSFHFDLIDSIFLIEKSIIENIDSWTMASLTRQSLFLIYLIAILGFFVSCFLVLSTFETLEWRSTDSNYT